MSPTHLTRILICAMTISLLTPVPALAWDSEPVLDCLGRTNLPAQNPPDYSKDSLGFVHERLDRDICWISPEDSKLQLLRAALVITVTARYAAAAIERYSDNRDEMALRVIPKVNRALDSLEVARNHLAPPVAEHVDRNYFEVYRADLVMRIAELLTVAVEPTKSEIRGLLSTSLNLSFAKHAFELFKNVTINELYGNAYRDGFMKHLSGIGSNNAVQDADFNTIAALLKDGNGGCKRLETMGGSDAPKCKILDVIE